MFKVKINSFRRNNSAFTIVELLVVIVVIGILSAITVVSYVGITNKANVASLSSDLTNASIQLKIFNVDNSVYPTTISTDCVAQPDTATNKCLKTSNSTTYAYYVDNTGSKQTYCITAIKNNYSYSINETGIAVPAAYCPVLSLDAGNKDSYPGNGTVWKDLSRWGNNGVLNGGVGYDTADYGSIILDGLDDYIGIPYNSLLAPASQITFEAAVYSSNWNITDYARILSKTEGGGYQIGLNGSVGVGYIGGLVYLNGSYRATNIALASLSPGWHYFSFTFDGRYFKMYSDGYSVNTYDLGSTSTVSYACNNYLMIGAEAGCGSAPVDGYFPGRISVVSIYNRALSASEILHNFNALKGRYGL